jgi:hypothetical protein
MSGPGEATPGEATWDARAERLMRRATFVFPASGRLGNQLFQYSALRSFRTADQRLLLVDFDDLAATFTGIGAELRSNTSPRDRVRLRVVHRARHLVGSPLGRVVQDPATHLPVWTVPGRVATVRGYFQRDHPGHATHVGALRFRTEVSAAADAFLRDRLPGRSGAPLAFVHVRRGDYLTHAVGRKPSGLGWVDDGPPVALPAAWYRERMDELRDLLPGVRLLLVGDDPTWAADTLAGPDTVVSDLTAPADLALLARCDAGVLSASSFAWWGAWFAGQHGGGPFLAPLHWLGHAVGEWWPAHVVTPTLTYRPVVQPLGAGRG